MLNDSLSSAEAGAVLGVTDDTFEDIAADFPWLKPFYFGKGKSRKIKRWQRAGVEALRYILANTPHEEASRAKPETKSSDGGG